ncbi:hypothetical protein EB796_019706 [Bugula neritina]|uniref:CUB domain-containing protein n=1 Tax=Bugula neritina TaxID=10212 RepID=A0A7J7J6X3_BUGNE|nr:hypothetical protein EB796_019706 [Bugula neritina]
MGSSSQQVDARRKPSGYVVSHSDYGQLDYRPQTNSRLTFTNVETVDIYFVDLNLEDYAKCYDYVIITGAASTKICQHQNASSFLQTWRSFNASSGFSVSIQFYSDNTGEYKGFLFQYKG